MSITYNSMPGTICNREWGEAEASVICKQLGFLLGGAAIDDVSVFGEGTGRIWLDRVRCTGEEENITQCGHAGWGGTSMYS